jgi:uncharacterized membrane protein
MIREHLMRQQRVESGGFRWRGLEVSRLEALSDAVFGFAITLLVVSLEGPRSYADLIETMRGFGAFAACFAILFLVWFKQYRWFRRYGMEDAVTVWLNAFLLFVIVFFVYPLKFVFGMVIGQLMGVRLGMSGRGPGATRIFTAADQPGKMMVIFGVGYALVFLIFALMYHHSWRHRDALELDEGERFETLTEIRECLINVGIAVASMILSVRFSAGMGGFAYMMTGPILGAHGYWSGARKARLDARLAAERAAAAEAGPEAAPDVTPGD